MQAYLALSNTAKSLISSKTMPNLNSREKLLAEMDIEQWQLQHAERLEGYQQPAISLPDSVKLLFVSPLIPAGQDAEFLQKVLKAMQLQLSDCRHLYPNQVSQLSQHQLQWVWFSACAPIAVEGVKEIHSPALSEIDGHNQNRRQLWNQIQNNA